MSSQVVSCVSPEIRVNLTGGLSAAQRVRKHSEFQKIQSNASRVVSRGFVFLAVWSGEERPARLGVTASRRVGNAVVRNRCKRLVREAFRETRDIWPDSVDLVVIVRHSTGKRRLGEVVSEWRGAERKFKRLWTRIQPSDLTSATVLRPRP